MACPLPAARLQGVRDEGDRRAGRITLHDIGPSVRQSVCPPASPSGLNGFPAILFGGLQFDHSLLPSFVRTDWLTEVAAAPFYPGNRDGMIEPPARARPRPPAVRPQICLV